MVSKPVIAVLSSPLGHEIVLTGVGKEIGAKHFRFYFLKYYTLPAFKINGCAVQRRSTIITLI